MDRSRNAAADISIEDPNFAPDATGRDRTMAVASLATTPTSDEKHDLARALAEAVRAGHHERAVNIARAMLERDAGGPMLRAIK